jgi:hypothetical protein
MAQMAREQVRRRIDAIFRPDPMPDKKALLAGMTRRAKELDQQFLANARGRARVREALAPSLLPLRDQLTMNAKTVKELRELRKARTPKPSRLRVPRHVDRIFSGSVGASYGPPYDAQWAWSQTQGDPPSPVAVADANSGTMRLLANTLDDSSAVAARAAVGNWLTAPLGTSTMKVSAAPAFSWGWDVFVWLNWGEAAGWLGFVVESFDRQGNYIETLIEQMNPLFDQQLSTSGNQYNNGTTTGYPISAQFTAIEGLFYTIWVWFGVYAAEGDECFAQFDPIAVPYFAWENG